VKRVFQYCLCLVFLVVAFQGCKGLTAGRPDPLAGDVAIAARIRALISEDPALSPSAIRVFVVEGRVTLSGPVPDGRTKSRLLAKARRVMGVKSVSDNLELPTPP
jgi:osmotically-inducible protein OsmY